MKYVTINHAWRPVNPQTAFFGGFDFLHRRNRLPEKIPAMCGSRRGDEYLYADSR